MLEDIEDNDDNVEIWEWSFSGSGVIYVIADVDVRVVILTAGDVKTPIEFIVKNPADSNAMIVSLGRVLEAVGSDVIVVNEGSFTNNDKNAFFISASSAELEATDFKNSSVEITPSRVVTFPVLTVTRRSVPSATKEVISRSVSVGERRTECRCGKGTTRGNDFR